MKKTYQRLPESELDIMLVLWNGTPPMTRPEIEKVINTRKNLAPTTILSLLTRLEELVAMGKLKRGSRDYMEKKNIITRAVGVSEDVDTDLFALKLKSGDQILMCSDGLSNMVDELEMEYIIRSEDGVEARAKALVDAANRSGGQDNISVVLVEPQISEVSL
mgnify:CR=1 FL=1